MTSPGAAARPNHCEPSLIVCIPTFRRPRQLRRLLAALHAQCTERPLAILVADNDAELQQGRKVIERLDHRMLRFPVHCMVVEHRSLASVRNALLAAALQFPAVQHVAMIDDDEWPEANWIEALAAMQEATGADIVGGPVHSAFETHAPQTVTACRLFQPYDNPDGPIEIVWATNNVLLSRTCLQGSGPEWFDQRYGLSGGEDVDFFMRQRREGRQFAWAAAAVVNETVPHTRARFPWIIQRAFRVGNTNAHIQRRQRFRGRSAMIVFSVAAAKLGAALVSLPVRALRISARANALCDLAEAGGMLLGAVGYRYDEYSK